MDQERRPLPLKTDTTSGLGDGISITNAQPIKRLKLQRQPPDKL